MKIGHLDEPGILEKIRRFSAACCCERYELAPAAPGETPAYNFLNIELSLVCQGTCAMCCVGAPDWHGRYDYYDSLTRMVEQLRPREIMVQGGEVLIQKKSLMWIEQVLRDNEGVTFSLVTNGNVGAGVADLVERLFSGRVIISIAGFQPVTYRTIMGMDVANTIAFAERLAKGKKAQVVAKYLVTPISLHETGLFLDWAIALGPTLVDVADANTASYVRRDTPDRYWEKVIERTSESVRSLLVKKREALLSSGLKIGFDTQLRHLFSLDDSYLRENGLENVVFWKKN